MRKISLFFLSIFFTFSFSTAQEDSKTQAIKKIHADKTKSSITYEMSHPMHDWEGVCKDVNAVLRYNNETKTIETIAASAKIACFNSNNENRDSHTIEVLDAIKYPNVTFAGKIISTNNNQVNIAGELNFHGIKKPISVVASWQNIQDYMVLTGSFSILMTDYNIEKPSLMGVATKNNINIRFVISFNQKEF